MNPVERVIRRVDAAQQRHRVSAFVFGVIKKYGDDNGGVLAGNLTHSAFVSVFPLLLILEPGGRRRCRGNRLDRAAGVRHLYRPQLPAHRLGVWDLRHSAGPAHLDLPGRPGHGVRRRGERGAHPAPVAAYYRAAAAGGGGPGVDGAPGAAEPAARGAGRGGVLHRPAAGDAGAGADTTDARRGRSACEERRARGPGRIRATGPGRAARNPRGTGREWRNRRPSGRATRTRWARRTTAWGRTS